MSRGRRRRRRRREGGGRGRGLWFRLRRKGGEEGEEDDGR
jgi:hypothetical protein